MVNTEACIHCHFDASILKRFEIFLPRHRVLLVAYAFAAELGFGKARQLSFRVFSMGVCIVALTHESDHSRALELNFE